MKIQELNPAQVITLNDFPVHNEHILKIFFKIYKDGYGKIIPPCPVIHKKLVICTIDKKLQEKLKEFEKTNQEAEYFLLDGSHKTTAANLTHNKIKAMIFENNKDIEEAKELVEIGELFSLSVDNTIEKNIKSLNKHFTKKPYFETVQQKTKRMIKEKVIPHYMIKFHEEKK